MRKKNRRTFSEIQYTFSNFINPEWFAYFFFVCHCYFCYFRQKHLFSSSIFGWVSVVNHNFVKNLNELATSINHYEHLICGWNSKNHKEKNRTQSVRSCRRKIEDKKPKQKKNIEKKYFEKIGRIKKRAISVKLFHTGKKADKASFEKCWEKKWLIPLWEQIACLEQLCIFSQILLNLFI